MVQPPVPGRDTGAEPGREPGLPGGRAGVPSVADAGREQLLAEFGSRRAGDRFPPNGWLAMMLDELSGPDRRCPGASDDALIGLLGRWQALESWASAGKLGVAAELVRRRARPGHQNRRAAGLPTAWEEGTGHEAAAALAMSLPSADNLLALAADLQARLPHTYRLLAAGTITYVKAKIIADELAVLDDGLAAQAEALIAGQLAGKTPGQVTKLAASAVVSVDPKGAEKRREAAERKTARVQFWREAAGTCALAAYGLPTDAALAANANIARRARQYKKAKLEGSMDQLRVLAYLDILNAVAAQDRIARAHADAASDKPPDEPRDEEPRDDERKDDDPSDDVGLGTDGTGDSEPGDDRAGDGGPGGGGGGPRGSGGSRGDAGPELAASTNLTLPLATLQRLAERPGQGHGLGPLDPALARDLAAAAARSPHSTWCLTITSPQGYAIGHGCARPVSKQRRKAPPTSSRAAPWSLTRDDDRGPPGGYGCWTLTLPGGRQFAISLGPVPVSDCDHRHESHGYQPGDTLRHLVQVRDGECTFPQCSRHARESDFEHALPYDQGGRTCGCNAGSRSRRCHRVKQSSGWTVTQPLPGWHQWTTSSGRTYTQGPMKYPA